MKIELATIQDVPELQKLQHKPFGPQCIELGYIHISCKRELNTNNIYDEN